MNQGSKTARIFLACACGSGIGSLAALQLGHFWGLGALFGALAGYLVYDLEQVIKMIPVAWKKTLKSANKSNLDGALVFLKILFACILVVMFVFMTAIFGDFIFYTPKYPGFSSSIFLVFMINVFYWLIKDVSAGMEKKEIFFFLSIYKTVNPIGFYIYYPMKSLLYLPWAINIALSYVFRFIKALFLLIHSDLRLLCGINSLLGAVIGYFFGNALIGALAGGLLGVVDYEIVSKQILKVHLKS